MGWISFILLRQNFRLSSGAPVFTKKVFPGGLPVFLFSTLEQSVPIKNL